MKIINRTRQKLYNSARKLGDVNAVFSGRPDKIAKRYLRKKSGRRFGKVLRGLLK